MINSTEYNYIVAKELNEQDERYHKWGDSVISYNKKVYHMTSIEKDWDVATEMAKCYSNPWNVYEVLEVRIKTDIVSILQINK